MSNCCSSWCTRNPIHGNARLRYGDTPYHLADEDLVIRFIKHLVRISLKRSTFYAVLAIGRLSYDYGTSEVRQIYDVLMQDGARFRDNPYLRKQKRVLMREVIERFGKMVRVVETPDREHRFLAQPTTQMLIDLVRECLRSFTPWNTTCVLPARFDPTDKIPALCFSGTDSDDESLIELNRFHTALDPDCFSRIVASLGFDSPDKRLAMPQFFISNGATPRGDRSNPPLLADADYSQFKQTREERSRRRRAFFARGLQIYVDGVECAAFDPRHESRVAVMIKPTANVVEVHGQDGGGDLPLMTLLVDNYDIQSGESIKDALLLEGGQKFTTSITPVINNIGDIDEVHVEINYAETRPLRMLALLFLRAWSRLGKSVSRPAAGLRELKPRYSWLALTSVAAALILGVSAIIWRQLDQPALDLPAAPQSRCLRSRPAGYRKRHRLRTQMKNKPAELWRWLGPDGITTLTLFPAPSELRDGVGTSRQSRLPVLTRSCSPRCRAPTRRARSIVVIESLWWRQRTRFGDEYYASREVTGAIGQASWKSPSHPGCSQRRTRISCDSRVKVKAAGKHWVV